MEEGGGAKGQRTKMNPYTLEPLAFGDAALHRQGTGAYAQIRDHRTILQPLA